MPVHASKLSDAYCMAAGVHNLTSKPALLMHSNFTRMCNLGLTYGLNKPQFKTCASVPMARAPLLCLLSAFVFDRIQA